MQSVLATKDKLLIAAEQRFLVKGYSATTVDEICRNAGTTKGAFFHHFKNKQDIVLNALERHAKSRFGMMLDGAPADASPKDKVLGYIDRMIAMASSVSRPACLIAAMTAELSDVEPEIQSRCAQAFDRWGEDLTGLLGPALRRPGPEPEAIAHLVMSTFQGSMLVARAKDRPDIIPQTMQSLRDYVETLLDS